MVGGGGHARKAPAGQHKFGKCVPKALRSYLQVPTLMSHHYLEVNPIRLGGKIRMALGAQHASPCAPGRRRARIALETQPLPAALPAAVLRIALGLSITQRAAAADAVPTAQTARSALQPRTQCPVAHARRCGGTGDRHSLYVQWKLAGI